MPYQLDIDHERRTIAVKGFGKGTTADTLDIIASQRETIRSRIRSGLTQTSFGT